MPPGNPRLAESQGTSRTVYGILCERHTADAKKESTVTPQAMMRSTRSSVMGKIIAMAADKPRPHGSLTPRHRQRVQGRPQTSNFP